MSIYSLELNTIANVSATAAGDFKAAASNQPRILECSIIQAVANASIYGLGRPANTPVQSSPTLVLPENPADPIGLSGCATAWTTAPTVPAQFLRRAGLANSISGGIIWTFPRGLFLAVNGSIVIWNLATNATSMNFKFVEDE